MKKIILFLSAFIAVSSLFAQAPQGINYQGVARDPSGNAISMKNIGVQFTILQGGTNVFSETKNITTDTFGLYTHVIGSANPGPFTGINWAAGNLSIQIGIDPTGSSSYTTVATTQLQSVPYALYAGSAGGSSGSITSVTGSGPITTSTTSGAVTVGLGSVGPTTNTYGTVTAFPIISVDADGRVTSATTQTIPTPVSQTLSLSGNTLGISGGNSVTLPTPTSIVVANTPLSGDGSSSLPLTISTASNTTSGYLTSGDWNTFNNKVGSIVPGIGISATNLNSTYTISTTNTAPMWNANKLQGTNINNTAPLNGDILQYNGTNWSPAPLASSTGPWTLSGNQLFPTTYSNTLVGIGTNNPSASLDINSSNINGALNVNYTGSSGTPAVSLVSTGAGVTGLDVNTSSTSGDAIRATSNQGNALSGVSQTGPALWVQNNGSGSGSATIVSNQLNANGYSGSFTGGLGLQTDKIQITNTPTAGFVLTSDAIGNGTWQSVPGGVSSISVNAPLTSTGGSNPVLSIGTASATTSGYLTAGDWNTFNNKISAIIPGAGITMATGGGTVTVSAMNGSNIWNASQLQGININPAAPANGQILQYNGGQWVASPPPVVGASNGLSVTTGSVVLGGTLLNNTTITQNANNMIFNANAGNVQMNNSGAAVTLSVTTTGTGQAGQFAINNTGSNQPALNANTNGTGNAVSGGNISTTTGSGGYFSNNQATNTSPALVATTSGTGNAINATSISGTAINASNSGGNTISAQNSGTTGSSGFFQNTTPGNNFPTLNVITNSNTGSGGPAIFAQATAGSIGNAINASSVGTGSAGSFTVNNSTGNANALFSTTNGAGAAVNASNTGSGSAIVASTNAGNSSPAIMAISGGAGNSGKFTGGAGLYTDNITINTGTAIAGAVLTSSNAGGNAIWAGPVNFSGSGSITTTVPSASVTPIVFTTTPDYSSPSGAFNGGVFTAPVAGIYHLDVAVTFSATVALVSTSSYQLQIDNVPGGTIKTSIMPIPTGSIAGTLFQNRISTDIQMTSGEQIQVGVYLSPSTSLSVLNQAPYTYFTGHIIH